MPYTDIVLAQHASADNTGGNSISGFISQSDEMIVLLLMSSKLGRQNGDAGLLPIGNATEGFNLLFSFPSDSGLSRTDATPLMGFSGFLPSEVIDFDTQIARLSQDENEIIDFLAMLGIVTAVWEPSEERSHGVHDAPPPAAPSGVRRGSRDACIQWQDEKSHKNGWRESLCPDTGLSGAGFGGAGARIIGRGGIATGGGGGGVGGGGSGPNGGSNPGGVGGGSSPGGGGGSPGGGGGSDGGRGGGNGGNGPGSGSGGGTGGGNEGSLPPSEVRTVPEPATLALIALGLMGMCTARCWKHGSASCIGWPAILRLRSKKRI